MNLSKIEKSFSPNRGKIEKSFSPKLTDYFIQGVRNKRLCDSNAHVTTYGTVASQNGRSGEWSLCQWKYISHLTYGNFQYKFI